MNGPEEGVETGPVGTHGGSPGTLSSRNLLTKFRNLSFEIIQPPFFWLLDILLGEIQLILYLVFFVNLNV